MATSLLLIPLDDAVVFPTMDVTLPVDTGDEDRVLLVPRHDDAFAAVGTVAEVTDRVRLPGGAQAVSVSGLHRGVAGAAHTDSQGRLRVEVEERPDDVPVLGRTREAAREYRAVVEEILELRGDDGRVSAFVRSITEPGPLADTSGYAPDISYEDKVRLLETLDVTRASGAGARASSASAWPSSRCAGASATTSRRAPRPSSASTSCASRWSPSARSSARTTARSSRSTARKIDEAGMPDDVAETGPARAGPARAHGRAVRRGLDHPDVPRLV